MFFERHEHADQELPVFFNYQIHTSGGPRYELHWHETREWIYLVKGTVEIRTNDKIEIYNEGDIVTIAPQIPHSFYPLNSDASFYCLIPDNSILSSCGIDHASVNCDSLVTSSEIRRIFLDVIREFKEKPPYYKSCIRAKIILMYSLLYREHGHGTQKTPSPQTDRAMEITKNALQYMEFHYAEDFSGERLAKYLGFSRSYLCHVISSVTGKSLTENLLYVRCRKARELLLKGYPVGEVSFMVGFQSAPYFCRTYKRMIGVSPSAHINKQFNKKGDQNE